ncbi:glycosyltransferase [Pseudonocardia sp. T1-2H]|uniref:glycosyltransferase n=1 Tax=Pseudonocardia sp. T1-2H TaxID=3128899 RepID=UPI003101342D
MLTFAENLLPELVKQNPGWEFHGILPASVQHRLPHGIWSTITEDASQFRRLISQQFAVGLMARRASADVGFSLGPVSPLLGRKIPWVEVIHDWRHCERPMDFSLPVRAYRNVIYSMSLGRCSSYVCVSERTRETTRRLYPRHSPKSAAVIYHGVDHVLPTGSTIKGDYLLAYGHWNNKRPDIAVRLWAKTVKRGVSPAWRLKIVGLDSDTRGHLLKLAAELEVDGRLDLLGYCSSADFEELRARASVQLVTSNYEGFGLPVLEALAGGQVVFASSDVGMEEAGGTVAVFSDWTDLDHAAGAVARALNDPAWRETKISEGVQYAGQFRWSRCAEEYSRLIETVARQG